MLRYVGSDVEKRLRVDGVVSTFAMETCAACGVNVPKNKMLAYQETLQHKRVVLLYHTVFS